jgi:magnesium transporter
MSNGPTKVSEKVGLPPGALVYIGEKKEEPVQITTIHYDRESLEEKTFKNVQDCLFFKEKAPVSWVNVDGIHDVEILKSIAEIHWVLRGPAPPGHGRYCQYESTAQD